MTAAGDGGGEVGPVEDLLGDSPTNWGRWGERDEIGALNLLGPAEALAGLAEARDGRAFTLQTPIATESGEPLLPGREGARLRVLRDASTYASGELEPEPGGQGYIDDELTIGSHGSTHTDGLGHWWHGDRIWNGYPIGSTVGGLDRAGVMPIGEKGVVGRGVLIDMARHRGKRVLDRGETFDHLDLIDAAGRQGVEIRPRDVLVVRTGRVGEFFRSGRDAYMYGGDWNEPGLTYSPELVEWFAGMEIPNLVTDTIANETSVEPRTSIPVPLHSALMRNLGIAFTEIAMLEELARDSEGDGRWSFLYVAAPLKVSGASAGLVNPVAIK